MSFNIYIIKNQKLDYASAVKSIEVGFKKDQVLFSNESERTSFISELICKGKEISENSFFDSNEFDFEYFQLEIADKILFLSIPYWKSNLETQQLRGINKILECILNHHFLAIDQQSEITSNSATEIVKSFKVK